MHNLLEDTLISVRLGDGEHRLCLPQLLVELSARRVLAYTRMRPHQVDPFHVMTVQLGASVLARRKSGHQSNEVGFWRDGLLELAQGANSAWHLVEEDRLKPAFLQSPWLGSADVNVYRPKATSPDELDVLVTAKDHDVKSARARSDDPELWLYAAIVAQTISGFLGAGNYGVIRMNGGFGSRCIISAVRDPRPGPRFIEELPKVLAMREAAIGDAFNYSADGTVLTWLNPWDRAGPQHRLSDLDPLFVEATRPLRIVANESGLIALAATTASRQISGPDNGDCGDPWTALNVADKKKNISALTVSSNGLTPKLITDLLFQNGFRLTALQQVGSGNGRTYFCISVLVRGQGTTDGFHSVQIPIPEAARSALLHPERRDRLAVLARDLLTDASTIEGKCLRGAMMALAEGGPAQPDYDIDAVAAWANKATRRFAQEWRHDYFPTLWRAAEGDSDVSAIRARWAEGLVARARLVLEQAEQAVPVPSSRRLRAVVQARNIIEALFHKHGLINDSRKVAHGITS